MLNDDLKNDHWTGEDRARPAQAKSKFEEDPPCIKAEIDAVLTQIAPSTPEEAEKRREDLRASSIGAPHPKIKRRRKR